MFVHRIAAVIVASLVSVSTAQAEVTIGGRSFSDNAFADAVSIPAAQFLIWDGISPNLASTSDADLARAAMLDTPITQPGLAGSTFAACNSGQSEQDCGLLVVSFLDNVVSNGIGNDFTIFDIANPGSAKVTINGITVIRDTVFAGTVIKPGPGLWNLNASDFDLSDFGLASGAAITSMDVHWGYGEGNERVAIALVGALQPVPEPEAFMLMLIGFACVIGAVRRRS